MENFESIKAQADFIKAAKESIAEIPESKPEQKQRRRGRKNPNEELRKMFVKASDIRKKVQQMDIKTSKDEFILREDGKYVVSSDSYNYRTYYLKIKESLEKEKLLTGVVSSIEEIGEYWTAVIFMGDFKVMIPIFEFLDVNLNSKADVSSDDSRVMMSKRLGSSVDFMVKHFDEKTGVVIGSRLSAMRKKSEFFYKTKFYDEYLVNVGDTVKGRVVATSKAGLNVEIMGVEVFVPSKYVSYNYVLDASKYYSNGEEVDVKILDIFILEDGGVEVEASIAAVKEEMYKRIESQVEINKKYVGRISAINNYGVFVTVTLGDYELDILCANPSFGNMPVIGANAVVNVTNKNEKGLYGIIQNISFG